jgi:hypothetical protein
MNRFKFFLFVLVVPFGLSAMPRKRLAESSEETPRKRRRIEEAAAATLGDYASVMPYIEELTILKYLHVPKKEIEEKLEEWSQDDEFTMHTRLLNDLAFNRPMANKVELYINNLDEVLINEINLLREAVDYQYDLAHEKKLTPEAVGDFIDRPRVIEALLYSLSQEDRAVAQEVLLRLAARDGFSDTIFYLLNKGTDVNAKDTLGRTPLIHAAKKGYLEAVNLLLAALGVEVDEGDETPLMWSASKGHLDIVRRLLAAGADVNAAGQYNKTVLMKAVENGHEAVVQELLKAAANVNIEDDHQTTALILAAEKGHDGIVRQLLQVQGIQPDIQDDGFKTALIHAAINGHGGIVGQLIEAGADVNWVDEVENTALLYAVESGKNEYLEAIRLLLTAGADSNVLDEFGNTPLLIAVQEQDVNAINVLLEDPNINVNFNSDGETALSRAEFLSNEEIIQLLRQHGAQ